MARNLVDIIAQMDLDQASRPELTALNSPSQAAIYTLWKYIVALQIYLTEVLMDIKKTDVQSIVDKSFTGSSKWLQDRVFKFQYDAANPQITQLIDFAPTYPVVDPTLRIITRASVKTNALNQVLVKVAKQEPPIPLTGTELSALTGYLNQGGNGSLSGYGTGIGFAGISTSVQSYDSDKLYLAAEIFYDGQYASVIQANVIAAIDLYLANLPFDGQVKVLSLVDSIQSVQGVTDIVISDLAMRADTAPFTSKTYLIQAKTEILSIYPTFAGYIVGETTAGQDFLNTLIFTAQ